MNDLKSYYRFNILKRVESYKNDYDNFSSKAKEQLESYIEDDLVDEICSKYQINIIFDYKDNVPPKGFKSIDSFIVDIGVFSKEQIESQIIKTGPFQQTLGDAIKSKVDHVNPHSVEQNLLFLAIDLNKKIPHEKDIKKFIDSIRSKYKHNDKEMRFHHSKLKEADIDLKFYIYDQYIIYKEKASTIRKEIQLKYNIIQKEDQIKKQASTINKHILNHQNIIYSDDL